MRLNVDGPTRQHKKNFVFMKIKDRFVLMYIGTRRWRVSFPCRAPCQEKVSFQPGHNKIITKKEEQRDKRSRQKYEREFVPGRKVASTYAAACRLVRNRIALLRSSSKACAGPTVLGTINVNLRRFQTTAALISTFPRKKK